MSDNDKSLEDFFAKKAKGKKTKGKSKFTTSDAITKQVGSSQKETDSRSDQAGKKASGVTPTPSKPKEEEWIDFQEPTQKDYSGLRIQSLQIVENTEGEGPEGNEQEDDDDEGESSVKKEKITGPWKQAPAAAQAIVASQPGEEAKPVGAYRPPGYRAPGRRLPGSMGKTKTPEIDSEIAFPSLSASTASAAAAASAASAKSKETNNGGKKFETVKRGPRTLSSLADRRPQLDLENKFEALRRS